MNINREPAPDRLLFYVGIRINDIFSFSTVQIQ